MKKVTLICLTDDRKIALERLRSFGMMQLAVSSPSVATRSVSGQSAASAAVLADSLAKGRSAMDFLASSAGKKKSSRTAASSVTGEEAIEKTLLLAEKKKSLEHLRDGLTKDIDKMKPWGDFSLSELEEVKRKGINVYLCVSPVSTFETKEFPETAAVEEISRSGSLVHYVVISEESLSAPLLDLAPLAEKSLAELKSDMDKCLKDFASVDAEINSLSECLPAMKKVCEDTAYKLEFATAFEGMEKAGAVSVLTGYVPETETDKLLSQARSDGWALMIEDPSPDDDQVPTYIRKPKILNVLDPLFDFIGITPGYRENDVNVFFILFFPVFFGFIIGDAGYAALFIVAALVCKRIFRHSEAARLPLNLFLLLSAVTFVWGYLNGSWFGIPRDVLPEWMRGLDFLASPEESPAAERFARAVGLINDGDGAEKTAAAMGAFKNKFIQFLCFVIAGLHLASARIFKFFDDVRTSWRAFGHLGWAMLIVANSLLAIGLVVYPGSFPHWAMYLYYVGVALVVVTIRGSAALNLPFSLVGSFVDVLSYIRLFAVGLSGAYISGKFNEMGVMAMNAFPDKLKILGAAALIFVALFGNVLNVALGFLGVLVHAIRLNTLEFSNHIEMQWTGIKFRPFAEKSKKI